MLTVSDTFFTSELNEAIEASHSSPPENKIKDYVIAKGWFIKKKPFGGYESFKATDICWIYPREEHVDVLYFWHWNFQLKSGILIDLNFGLIPKSKSAAWIESLVKVQNLIPWAFRGHTPVYAGCWEKNRELFLGVQEKRLDIIRSGLKNGTLVITKDFLAIAPQNLSYSDTSSASTASLKLPDIGVKTVRNEKDMESTIYVEI